MDFSKILTQSNEDKFFESVARDLILLPEKFNELMQLFLMADSQTTQRGCNLILACIKLQPAIISPFVPKMINRLAENPPVAIKRNVLRILQNEEIPEEQQGEIIQYCFDYLLDSKEPIAVKAFSMTVVANHCKLYPELKNELVPILEHLKETHTGGVLARAKNVLMDLSKIED